DASNRARRRVGLRFSVTQKPRVRQGCPPAPPGDSFVVGAGDTFTFRKRVSVNRRAGASAVAGDAGGATPPRPRTRDPHRARSPRRTGARLAGTPGAGRLRRIRTGLPAPAAQAR